MKDVGQIQRLSDEVVTLRAEAAAKDQEARVIRERLISTERSLAKLVATVFVGVVSEPLYASFAKEAFGLLVDMEVKVGDARITLASDQRIEISVPGQKDLLVMQLRVGEELCFLCRPYPEDNSEGLYEDSLGLHIRAFASLEEASAWVAK